MIQMQKGSTDMDNITISHFENDAIQEKKLENYGWEKKDFLAGQELTVTITLGEYRELVASKATADQAIQASREKVAKLEQDLKKAQEQAERLKAENYDLQNKVLAARVQEPGDQDGEEGRCDE